MKDENQIVKERTCYFGIECSNIFQNTLYLGYRSFQLLLVLRESLSNHPQTWVSNLASSLMKISRDVLASQILDTSYRNISKSHISIIYNLDRGSHFSNFLVLNPRMSTFRTSRISALFANLKQKFALLAKGIIIDNLENSTFSIFYWECDFTKLF